MNDKEAMQRALSLALRGRGFVAPNPLVGAVIIKDGKLVAEGWHKEFGGPHAEVDAINNAYGENLEGATMFVNLEPCTHYGKTPPCAPLLIEKKFARIVIGMIDPNPEVSGKGIKMLQNEGIETEVGLLEQECRWLNRFYIKHITEKKPYVILKTAQSLDGCIAASTGESQWITCEESRRRVHRLRAECDAVLIGRKTALKDNPSLTVRDVFGRNSKRIILDSNLSLPHNLNIFTDDFKNNTLICFNFDKRDSLEAETLTNEGIKLLPIELNDFGKLSLSSILCEIHDRLNITSLLVEGGSSVFSSFVREQLFDEIHIFLAPMIIGSGIPAFGKFNINYLSEAAKLNIKAVMKSGSDIQIIAIPEKIIS